MQVLILSSLVAVFLGCFCIYRASPNQRWGSAPWPVAPARIAGIALLALGGWGCLLGFSVVAAVFVFCTALMLFFCLIPYIGVMRQLRRGDANEAR
ncbi:hypothetical protein [Achromobacter arsenitoxydans]|uniref:Uncharacterized protein n=1 Tax=Achromobacter arsenitoxydans SY8 TaxID=477184 RepID=H0F1Z9_9BURK|nr:hypothetical protein [Achromobacter arsenitoxydans]EHK67656.1 hypothetical protein KYC_03927 [Achromobacter arsenitoxydans SY8]